MTIDWRCPNPRSGLLGVWDQFVGPGATSAEVWLQTILPVGAALAAVAHGASRAPSWSTTQTVFAGVFALDIAGGVITNATSTAKRWYHRPGQGARAHLKFVLLHLAHLTLVAWLYLDGDLGWAVASGLCLITAALVVLSVPEYLRRPVAHATYVGALLLTIYGLPAPEGLEWFLPVFYLKLLVSHLPKEEPYRPEFEGDEA